MRLARLKNARNKVVTSKSPTMVLVSSEAVRNFVAEEYDRVANYTKVIYDTRDRFFTNYMTVAMALLGFLGYVMQQVTGGKLAPSATSSLTLFGSFALLVLVVFGLGTLFLLAGNWIARDYYRQRRKRLQRLLLSTPEDEAVRAGLQKYLDFSRNQTAWSYRWSSIYCIYISCISLSNSVALVLAANINFGRMSFPLGIGTVCVTVAIHHVITYLYVRLYIRSEYSEG
ncbi:MAG TPA: hypothetical protein VHE55_12695 [Fimbriimonadaceae bacterium]|nr:hypothetical protein [Fimbriimonadaceae bacterium]